MEYDMEGEKFWNHIIKVGTCWLWIGATYPNGYGRVRYKGKMCQTHRLAYEFEYGLIPDGMLICHQCDNRLCINPNHLFLGTYLDNNQDMIKKGRGIYFKGEQSGNHKLTEKYVNEIRKKYMSDNYTQRQLVKEYDVSSHAISCIVRYKTWKHI